MKMTQTQTKESRLMFAVVVVSVAALVISIAAAGYAFGVQIFAQSEPSQTTPQTREFTVITDIAAFNETIAGAPHDIFSPTFIHLNQGDTGMIHFINTEKKQGRYTVTV